MKCQYKLYKGVMMSEVKTIVKERKKRVTRNKFLELQTRLDSMGKLLEEISKNPVNAMNDIEDFSQKNNIKTEGNFSKKTKEILNLLKQYPVLEDYLLMDTKNKVKEYNAMGMLDKLKKN